MNLQLVEKPVHREDGALEVVNCWYTLQGEGPLAGTPAVFIRLAGCNLSNLCRACDTDYTSNRRLATVEQIVEAIQSKSPIARLVVITGGEPFRQNLLPLLRVLQKEYRVQIETNGTYCPQYIPYGTIIVCSPKTIRIHPEMDHDVSAYKYVVEHGFTDDLDGFPLRVLGNDCRVARPANLKRRIDRGEIFVQPCDEQDQAKNQANIKAAVEACMKFGYRLCLQTHKLVGLE